MAWALRTVWAAFFALWFVGPAWAQANSESGLIEIINEARAEYNVDPVRFEPRLTQIARELAGAIYAGQPIDNLGRGLSVLLEAKGYPSLISGANYATTSGAVRDLVDGWIEEQGRDSFILHPDVEEIGVAYKKSDGSPVARIPPNIWSVVVAQPARPAGEGWADRVIKNVNAFRATHDLPPLKRNAFLDRAAMAHARDMLARDFFAHINPSREDPGDRATAAGYRWSYLLENLAVGQPDARQAVQAWVRSKDGHREAMLDGSVTEVGVGYVFAPFDPGRINVLHYWAMSLGKPLN